MSRRFDLLLFSTHGPTIAAAVSAGLAAVVIDWELSGKARRQAGADTQIGTDTVADLRRVRAETRARVICRTDCFGANTHGQIDAAAEYGAHEVLLPMVTGPEEVEAALAHARGRVGVGILIETESAVRRAADLARLPISRAYVGLNDLSIARSCSCIFEPLVDGTVERVRQQFDIPFGFGGLTVPGRGAPVPVQLLMSEMSRLDCAFSFLRRSFHRDLGDRPVAHAIEAIAGAVAATRDRTPAQKARDRERLLEAVSSRPRTAAKAGQS